MKNRQSERNRIRSAGVGLGSPATEAAFYRTWTKSATCGSALIPGEVYRLIDKPADAALVSALADELPSAPTGGRRAVNNHAIARYLGWQREPKRGFQEYARNR